MISNKVSEQFVSREIAMLIIFSQLDPGPADWKSAILFIQENMNLISKWKRRGITILRLRSVSTKQLPQSRSDVWM